MGNENPERTKETWTPGKIVQLIKEVVTAILGFLVMGYTFYFAYKTFAYVGQPQINDAKDILLLMLGMAGIVIGYYFGRVPADARTTQAIDQAIAETARAENVIVQSRNIADQVDKVKDKISQVSAGTREDRTLPSDTTIDKKLQEIINDLRAIGTAGNR